MTAKQWLQSAITALKSKQIASYYIDCLLLLELVLKKDRSFILAHLDVDLTKQQQTKLDRLLQRRLNHEPMAYIRGFVEFYGYVFRVNHHALIPKPESESFIYLLAKHLPTNPKAKLIDIGTGSGCLAVSAKLTFPHLEVTSTDNSLNALKIAKQNATNLNAEVSFVKADLLPQKRTLYDVVLANLPYVPDNFNLLPESRYEPVDAIFGGADGLDYINLLAHKLNPFLNKGALVFVESLKNQHQKVKNTFATQKFKLIDSHGLVQLFSKI